MNTLSNKHEARDIYTKTCKQRSIYIYPEAYRIMHLKDFYRYMFHPEWSLLGKAKVEDSYLFHMVHKYLKSGLYSGRDEVFVLMPRGKR